MSTTADSLLDRLKSWPLALLPHQLLSGLVRKAARWQCGWWKNFLIRAFISHFRVDLSEAQLHNHRDFPDFNSFFTRALRPGARLMPESADAISCPVDGSISELGTIREGRLIQAKGREYSLETLLGGDPDRAAPFRDGAFITLYLSPRDYHRIHMPVSGRLQETCYIPGRLFSVAPHTVRAIPGLFNRNERLCSIFDTAAGPMALVMVGAIFVSCMETVWGGVAGPKSTGSPEVAHYSSPGTTATVLRQGEEMGRFNMGSTVILLFGRNRIDWQAELQCGGMVRLGQVLGHMRS